MKAKLFTLLVLLLPVISNAQHKEPEKPALDSLTLQTERLEKMVGILRKFNVSAYLQAQYQYGQKEAVLDVGEANEHPDRGFDRFGIRRGRIKFEYNDGIGTGAVQLEVNDKGVTFRDLFIGIKDPWTKRNRLTAGFFNRPFGHEVTYSTSKLESPERATIIQKFFPSERDLGIMLSLAPDSESLLSFLRLDAGLFAGNSMNRETDSRKDFIGRIQANKKHAAGEWGGGISYYLGGVYNPTDMAYLMQGNRFVVENKGRTGTYMKREYFGMNAQFSFQSDWGTTTLRGETLFGTQPGTALSSKSPDRGNRPAELPENALFKRPFLGYFFYLIQDIGRSPFSVLVKYDFYDPNRNLKGDEIGAENSFSTHTDLAENTVGIGGLYRFSKHIRLQVYYEIHRNETSRKIEKYAHDRVDNVLTARLQYKF